MKPNFSFCLTLVSICLSSLFVRAEDAEPRSPWPKSNEELLELLRERYKAFENRLVIVEQRWTERVTPKAELARRDQFLRERGGRLKVDPKKTIPEDYNQPHRVEYSFLTRNNEFTVKCVGEREKLINSEYGKTPYDTVVWTNSGGRFRSNDHMEIHIPRLLQLPSPLIKLACFQRWFVWSSGFGAASMVQTIEQRQPAGADKLRLVGKMQISGVENCHYELTIDKDLIVRNLVVKVHPPNADRFIFFAGTLGTIYSDDHPPVAKRGHYERRIQSNDKTENVETEFDIVFKSISSPLTEEQYKTATDLKHPDNEFVNKRRGSLGFF